MHDLKATPLSYSVFDHQDRCLLEGDQSGEIQQICVRGVSARSKGMPVAVPYGEGSLPGYSRYRSVM
jgi:hypothetical protein